MAILSAQKTMPSPPGRERYILAKNGSHVMYQEQQHGLKHLHSYEVDIIANR